MKTFTNTMRQVLSKAKHSLSNKSVQISLAVLVLVLVAGATAYLLSSSLGKDDHAVTDKTADKAKLVERADRMTAEADTAYEGYDFEAAKDKYSEAKRLYEESGEKVKADQIEPQLSLVDMMLNKQKDAPAPTPVPAHDPKLSPAPTPDSAHESTNKKP